MATSVCDHPLHRSWQLWYDSPSTYQNDWEQSLVPIVKVSTVNDFFAMQSLLKPVHSVRSFAQFSFFQVGVKPMWEDAANMKGGKLWFNVMEDTKSNDGADAKAFLDSLWENILMALVGETLENSTSEVNDVMGVVLSKRKNGNRVAIWIRDAEDEERIHRVKGLVEEMIPASCKVTFTKHGEKQ